MYSSWSGRLVIWFNLHMLTLSTLTHCNLLTTLQLATMVMFAWLVGQHPMRGELRCANMMNGVQFVIEDGTPLMPKWSADNSDMIRKVHILMIFHANYILLITTFFPCKQVWGHITQPALVKELEAYTYHMLGALEQKSCYWDVPTALLLHLHAVTIQMQEWDAQVKYTNLYTHCQLNWVEQWG